MILTKKLRILTWNIKLHHSYINFSYLQVLFSSLNFKNKKKIFFFLMYGSHWCDGAPVAGTFCTYKMCFNVYLWRSKINSFNFDDKIFYEVNYPISTLGVHNMETKPNCFTKHFDWFKLNLPFLIGYFFFNQDTIFLPKWILYFTTQIDLHDNRALSRLSKNF